MSPRPLSKLAAGQALDVVKELSLHPQPENSGDLWQWPSVAAYFEPIARQDVDMLRSLASILATEKCSNQSNIRADHISRTLNTLLAKNSLDSSRARRGRKPRSLAGCKRPRTYSSSQNTVDHDSCSQAETVKFGTCEELPVAAAGPISGNPANDNNMCSSTMHRCHDKSLLTSASKSLLDRIISLAEAEASRQCHLESLANEAASIHARLARLNKKQFRTKRPGRPKKSVLDDRNLPVLSNKAYHSNMDDRQSWKTVVGHCSSNVSNVPIRWTSAEQSPILVSVNIETAQQTNSNHVGVCDRSPDNVSEPSLKHASSADDADSASKFCGNETDNVNTSAVVADARISSTEICRKPPHPWENPRNVSLFSKRLFLFGCLHVPRNYCSHLRAMCCAFSPALTPPFVARLPRPFLERNFPILQKADCKRSTATPTVLLASVAKRVRLTDKMVYNLSKSVTLASHSTDVALAKHSNGLPVQRGTTHRVNRRLRSLKVHVVPGHHASASHGVRLNITFSSPPAHVDKLHDGSRFRTPQPSEVDPDRAISPRDSHISVDVATVTEGYRQSLLMSEEEDFSDLRQNVACAGLPGSLERRCSSPRLVRHGVSASLAPDDRQLILSRWQPKKAMTESKSFLTSKNGAASVRIPSRDEHSRRYGESARKPPRSLKELSDGAHSVGFGRNNGGTKTDYRHSYNALVARARNSDDDAQEENDVFEIPTDTSIDHCSAANHASNNPCSTQVSLVSADQVRTLLSTLDNIASELSPIDCSHSLANANCLLQKLTRIRSAVSQARRLAAGALQDGYAMNLDRRTKFAVLAEKVGSERPVVGMSIPPVDKTKSR